MLLQVSHFSSLSKLERIHTELGGAPEHSKVLSNLFPPAPPPKIDHLKILIAVLVIY